MYEVALSFAGEQRGYVEDVARALQSRGIIVFYDEFEKIALWGKHLAEEFQRIYEQSAAPKVHIGLLLELWRALADIAMHHVHGKNYETLAYMLGEYIQQGVIVVAEQDDDWQAASQDENNNTNFGEIRQWIRQNGGVLKAGIDLFDHRARGSWHSLEASPLLRQVLFRAAERAVREAETDRANRSKWQNIDIYPAGEVVYFQNPATYKARWTDIDMFHGRSKGSGLTWNADKGVFE